jgi:hypothetical protein
MSLLSDTQGKPERVLALVKLLQAVGGAMPREDVFQWLLPKSVRPEEGDREKSDPESAIRQTLGAASGLGLTKHEGKSIQLADADPPTQPDHFADWVHRALCDSPTDANEVMMNAYAAVVIRCEQETGTSWIGKAEDFSQDLNRSLKAGLDDDAGRVFNKDKLPTWREWIIYLGLGTSGTGLPQLYPTVTERLDRELDAIGDDEGFDHPIAADRFLVALGKRMPYLDHGNRLIYLASRQGVPLPPNRVTWLASQALRELHGEGRLILEHGGDATDAVLLAEDLNTGLKHFRTVTISRRAA